MGSATLRDRFVPLAGSQTIFLFHLLIVWHPAPLPRGIRFLFDHPQFFGEFGQDFAAIPGDDDVILDPHAALSGDVNAGFDGEYHPFPERLFVGGAHGGKFMDLQAQAVTDAVGEPVPVSGGGDHLPGGLVDFADGGAGGAALEGGLLGS